MRCSSGAAFGVTDLLSFFRIGTTRDYYIALGIVYKGYYEFPFKKFYWTTSANFKFEPLPQPNDQNKKDADERESLFLGEPEKVLIEVKPPENAGQPAEVPDPAANPNPNPNPEGKVEEKKESLEDSTEVKPQVVPKNFTELDRLAYVVTAIENDTHVIPEGAFKMIPSHEVRRNEGFRGK